ncbi:MAG TPA: GrdX family protein [Anaerovoracaceae bacterium]|nr:GrdX family protein [Anaerovoracaceae bacterium]
MDILIVTNNNKVYETYKGKMDVLYLKGSSYLKVLEQARDLIHLGARLLSDPMAGNLRPNQTPYKSVLLEGMLDSGRIPEFTDTALDRDSLRQIECSIGMAKLFQDISKTPDWPLTVKEDFMTVDLSLLGSAIS